MKSSQGYTIRTEQEETRKGPWTEQEDLQLVCFVGFFGERRWDFIAKVSGLKVEGEHCTVGRLIWNRGWWRELPFNPSGFVVGLNRTGKSCRLRWVNYLRPDLKRGRMTPQEEELVLELHSRWGNRWSLIARKLPGRTDNEIKNYWRTHMRKKAQERKNTSSPASSPSDCCTSSPSTVNLKRSTRHKHVSDDVTSSMISQELDDEKGMEGGKGSLMEQIWKEIAASDVINGSSDDNCKEEGCNPYMPSMASSLSDYCSYSPWRVNEEELDPFVSHNEHGRGS